MKRLQLFHPNDGLTSLEKCQFCGFLKSMFLWSRKACFLTRTSPNVFFFTVFCIKREVYQNLWKMQILWFSNRNFYSLEGLVSYINVKNRIFFFHDLLSRSITWGSRGYKGLQGLTAGYKWLQGQAYFGLQRVKSGYMWLEEVTGGYRGESIILGKTFINIL